MLRLHPEFHPIIGFFSTKLLTGWEIISACSLWRRFARECGSDKMIIHGFEPGTINKADSSIRKLIFQSKHFKTYDSTHPW